VVTSMELIPSPRYALVEITWNCNLNCVMCPRNICGYKMGTKPHMSLERFRGILDSIPTLRNINMAGCGEPLYHPEFHEMARECVDRDIEITLTSNGTLLSRSNIEKIPRSGKVRMHVSIDSPVPGIYKKYRRVDLSLVLRNLERLKRIRPDIELTIQPLIMRDTLPDMRKIIPIARRYDARLSPIYPIAFSKDDEERLHPFSMEDFDKMMTNLHYLSDHFGVPIYEKPSYPTPKDCVEPFVGPVISVKGEIFGCCYAYEARRYSATPRYWDEYYRGKHIRVPQHDYLFGNIFKDDFKEVWRGDEYRDLRRTLMNLRKHEMTHPYNLDQYMILRDQSNIKKRFDYCSMCLWRWNQAC